jgi:hypothetical protein
MAKDDKRWGRGKGSSRFPRGMTERKARATTREEADPCGMTARKATAREEEIPAG